MSSRDESLPVSPDGSARSSHSADNKSSGRVFPGRPHGSASNRSRESSSSKTSARSWHRRASRPVSLWLAAIIVLALAHPFVPNNRWMMVHFFTLGALMNSIMVWSQHFTEKFLHQRLPDSSRPRQVALIYALNVGVIFCVIGQAFNDAARGTQGWAWIVVTVGAVIVGVAVAIHAISLILQWVKARRGAAKSGTELGDYAAIVMFYIAASLILPIGAGLGATLAHPLPGAWHDRLIVMHMAVNVLGFVGLTAAGTLTILFPAIWRARVSAFRPTPTLATMLGGILVLSIGTISGRFELVGIGMVVYGAGWILCARPWAGIVRNSRRISHEPPAIFARSSVVFAVLWVIGTMLAAGISQILNPDEIISTPTVPLVVGFGAQLLIGVMCYLLPSTMGGGGKAVSQGLATLDFIEPARTTMVNVGLTLWVLPVGGWLHIVGSFAAGIGLAMFIPLAAVSAKNQVKAIRTQAAARRKKAEEQTTSSASSTSPADDARIIPPNPPHSRSPLKPEFIRDPSVGPAPEGTTHNIDLTVSQVNRTIHEDGTKRASWTFNGAPMGPVLRGHVGDEFVVHLKNDGSISHSIDLHAGMVSPDQPMRSIKPGESLEYRFRAEHAGIWLYHCGTAPISMHIAAGMFGAVIIDPPDLDPVDHEYIMVQSELYGLGKDKDNPVDSALLHSEQPSKVVFNGLENQYVQKPLELKHGERARFWLLNAGPNISESFHIVGTQFDTSFKEGSYTLRHGHDAFGVDDGGSQALDLLAAQGGFVEADFPEAGTYTMVNHQFADAERGAMGKIKVS